MRWEKHVVGMGEMRNAHKIPVGIPEVKNHSEDLDMDGKIQLKWIIKNRV
jgi:hypothetical protein